MVEFTNINTLNSTKMDKYCLNRNHYCPLKMDGVKN